MAAPFDLRAAAVRSPLGRGAYEAAIRQAAIKGQQAVVVSLRAAVIEMGRSTQREGVAILRDMSASFSIDRNRAIFQAAHDDLATKARTAMVLRFDQTRSSSVSDYRQGRNRLTGLLRDALDNEAMNLSTPFRISFVNTELLDRQARHWRRINFGALPRPGSASRTFQAVVAGQPLLFGVPRGPAFGPRPAFTIPRGFWRRGGPGGRQVPWDQDRTGMDAFFPRRGATQFFPTRGIKAHHFVDAGFEVIAQEADRTYRQVLRDVKNARRRVNRQATVSARAVVR